MIHQAFDWLLPPVTQHVSLALLHFLWQGTLIALVLAVVLRLFRDQVPTDLQVSLSRLRDKSCIPGAFNARRYQKNSSSNIAQRV